MSLVFGKTSFDVSFWNIYILCKYFYKVNIPLKQVSFI